MKRSIAPVLVFGIGFALSGCGEGDDGRTDAFDVIRDGEADADDALPDVAPDSAPEVEPDSGEPDGDTGDTTAPSGITVTAYGADGLEDPALSALLVVTEADDAVVIAFGGGAKTSDLGVMIEFDGDARRVADAVIEDRFAAAPVRYATSAGRGRFAVGAHVILPEPLLDPAGVFVTLTLADEPDAPKGLGVPQDVPIVEVSEDLQVGVTTFASISLRADANGDGAVGFRDAALIGDATAAAMAELEASFGAELEASFGAELVAIRAYAGANGPAIAAADPNSPTLVLEDFADFEPGPDGRMRGPVPVDVADSGFVGYRAVVAFGPDVVVDDQLSAVLAIATPLPAEASGTIAGNVYVAADAIVTLGDTLTVEGDLTILGQLERDEAAEIHVAGDFELAAGGRLRVVVPDSGEVDTADGLTLVVEGALSLDPGSLLETNGNLVIADDPAYVPRDGNGKLAAAGISLMNQSRAYEAAPASAPMVPRAVTPGAPEVLAILPIAGVAGDQVTFEATIDPATPVPATWKWEFGGGSASASSSAASPRVRLGDPGAYAGTLSVTKTGLTSTYQFVYLVFEGEDPRRDFEWNLCAGINLTPDPIDAADLATWIFTRAKLAGCFSRRAGGGGGPGPGPRPRPIVVWNVAAPDVASPPDKVGGCGVTTGRRGSDGRDLSLWVIGDFRLGGDVVLQALLGNGAHGQNVAASCGVPGEPATARGGRGGVPGSFIIQSGLALGIATKIDVQGRIDVQLGTAGAGGDAAVFTSNALARCPIGLDAGAAIAIGGRGGNTFYGAYGGGAPVGGPPGGIGPGAAGVLFWSQGEQNLANVRLFGSQRGGEGGEALALAGRGGDGAMCGCHGGAGGYAGATSGDGGDTTVELGPGAAEISDISVARAGDGGLAVARGGNGGAGGSCPVDPPRRGGNGGPGGWVDAIAGVAGEVFVGMGADGVGKDPHGFPGDGGNGGDGCLAGDGGPNGIGTERALGVVDIVFGRPGAPGADNCVLAPGQCVTSADCVDDNECTEDFCLDGECQHIGTSGALCGVGLSVPCIASFCDGAACVVEARPDGSACDLDGNPCTAPNTCFDGACVGGRDVSCPYDELECQDLVCDPSSGKCEPAPEPDGFPCTDYDACTHDDRCEGGSCVGGETVTPCEPVCCRSGGGAYYDANAADCEFIVRDATLCNVDCCQGPEGEYFVTARGYCHDLGGQDAISSAQCDEICCDDGTRLAFAARGNCSSAGGAEAPIEACDTVCCDVVSHYWSDRGRCQNIVPDVACEPVCCEFDRYASVMERGDCARADGSEVAAAQCVEVCCKNETGSGYRPREAAKCSDDRVVDWSFCSYECCESNGQRYLAAPGECSGEVLAVEECEPQCCAVGTEVFAEALSCEAAGAEIAEADDCDKICCLLDGKTYEWRTSGICKFLDGEVVDKSNCANYVCCVSPGGASLEFASNCEFEALPLEGGGTACDADADCDDQDPCTGDVCSGECGFCVNAPLDCDDHVDCTVDSCLGGECVHLIDDDVCGPTDACAVRFCDESAGCQEDPLVDCNDQNACTSDACNAQTGCSHRSVTCPTAPVCHRSSCDPGSGCETEPLADGTTCGGSKVCKQGACVSGLTIALTDCWEEVAAGESIDVGSWVSGGSGTTTVTLTGGSTGYAQAFTVAGTTLNVGASGPKGYGGDAAARVRIQRGNQSVEVLAVARFAGPGGGLSAQLTGFDGSGPTGTIAGVPELGDGGSFSAFVNGEGAGWVCDANSCAYCWASRVSVATTFTGLAIGAACTPGCEAGEACLLESGGAVCRETNPAETATCVANDSGNLFVVGRGCVWKSLDFQATYVDANPSATPGTHPVDIGVPFTIGPVPAPASGCGFVAMQYEFTASPPLGCQQRLSAGGSDVLGLHVLTVLKGN